MSRESPSVNIKELSNIQLVQVCARDSRNEAAWEEFVNRFNQHIAISVIRVLRSNSDQLMSSDGLIPPDVINDLIQQVYVRLLDNDRQALKRFRGEHEKSIFAYLARLTTTVVLDYLRRRSAGRRPPELISWTEIEYRLKDSLDEMDSCSATLSSSDLENRLNEGMTVRDMIAQLQCILEGEHKRRDILIFVLYVFDGLTAEEIAAQPGIGLTPNGVRSVLIRLKRKLKEHMKPGADAQSGEKFSGQ